MIYIQMKANGKTSRLRSVDMHKETVNVPKMLVEAPLNFSLAADTHLST